MYNSELKSLAKVNVPVTDRVDVSTNEYIGFLAFPYKKCGADFLNKLDSGEVTLDIFDYESLGF